jgi:hypothetical protein
MKTKERTIITTPSNEPLSTREQSLTRPAGVLGGGPCKIEESQRRHLSVPSAGSPTKPLTRAVGRLSTLVLSQ